jgi:hypothetical protein
MDDMDMHGDGRNARGRGKGSLLCLLAVCGGHGDLNLTCVHAGCHHMLLAFCSLYDAESCAEGMALRLSALIHAICFSRTGQRKTPLHRLHYFLLYLYRIQQDPLFIAW